MQEKLFNKQAFSQAIEQITTAPSKSLPQLVTGLDDSARSIFIAQQFKQAPTSYLIVEPRATQLNEMYEDLKVLLPEVPVLFFPAEESLAIEYSISSKDNMAQRIDVLNQLATGEDCIILAPVSGLRKRLTPVKIWRDHILKLQLGMELERDDFALQLGRMGYRNESMIQAPGEFSVRGSIIDIFPLNFENPIRLDFFDTELDSIRYFDPDSQLSQENIESVMIYPAEDIIFSISDQQSILADLESHLTQSLASIKDESLKLQLESIQREEISKLKHGEPLKYKTAYLSLWDENNTSILDYLPQDSRLLIMELGRIQQNEFQMIEEDQFWLEQEIIKGQLLPNIDLRLSAYNQIRESNLTKTYFSVMQRGLANLKFSAIHPFSYRSMNQFYNQYPLIKAEIGQWLKQGYLVQILVSSDQQAKKTIAIFEEYDIKPILIQKGEAPQLKAVNILKKGLSKGFELPADKWVVVTEAELFNKMRQKKIKQSNLTNAERIKNYNELNVGDYVVHLSHGIGRYTGIETMEINGVHKDLIAIEYQDNARVLLPVEKIQQLQKYVTSESKTPKVNKLGGTEWAKTKQKVQTKIEDIADELIELYAKREQEKGYAFGPDTPEQKEFEDAFPYMETPDQLRSAEEIKRDMEKARPMDRLLIGDVGYGKTEVAIRAIFKAVMEGKQVAFLVPTTILAQQHYNSIIERFAAWPFEVGLLSRFVSRADQKETIKGLANGAISIVIGTHRILSKDIKFNDLGLLIVDEEQRFGVKHKERLKQLKSQVDVLTLTATPIPRTLHMSMIGIRDLSVIETPPNNRYPVQTYVMERNEGVIKTAVERELARGGQVFYLYNRVATIHQRASELSELIPEARVAVAHGQMSEVELERVLVDFISGQYDLLVTTTIIETGVDIPNANTLFVDNSDKMGLSTLYQLRGRVGRTHRLAYAYLMYDPFKQLSEVSEKRLNAIREFTELGSGFKIAMRDLSIRGAGNLLGKQQSGFIDSVGYDLYTQMLKEAIDIRRGKKSKTASYQDEFEWQVDIDAYIPSDYIEDGRQKIGVYKSIQQIDSQEAYRELQDQLIDRFGEFPDEVSDLLDIALIKHYSIQSGIVSITRERQDLLISFSKAASQALGGPNIFAALQDIPLKAKVQMHKEQLILSLNIYNKANDQWLDALIKFTAKSSELLDEGEGEE